MPKKYLSLKKIEKYTFYGFRLKKTSNRSSGILFNLLIFFCLYIKLQTENFCKHKYSKLRDCQVQTETCTSKSLSILLWVVWTWIRKLFDKRNVFTLEMEFLLYWIVFTKHNYNCIWNSYRTLRECSCNLKIPQRIKTNWHGRFLWQLWA